MDPTGAAINCAIVRFRLFEPINCTALKSCISASEVTAIVPVSPLDDMLTGTLPGEMKAKIACIMFDIALMGPQFVSPSTRKPTSISGSDKRMAINESLFFFQAEDGIRDDLVTGVQTCALPI